MLNAIIHTPSTSTDQPPLVIAHGLYGSARNWGVIAKRLSDTRKVIAVDMRNHGESDWFSSHTYADLANDLAEVIKSHTNNADVLGHSMGGKGGMCLALAFPELVRRLIVADIAPVAYSHSQVQYINAMRSLDPAQPQTRAEADALLASEVDDKQIRAFLLQSLNLRDHRWQLNLDVLEQEMPKIVGWPDPNGRFDGSTLFLSGGASDYVLPDHRPTIKALFPKSRFAKIPGAGHWLHAENPRAFEAAVRAFLD